MMKRMIPLMALLLCAAYVPHAEAAAPVKILPLGDSLTSGYSVPTYLSGYRDRLYSRLADAGYDLDYLGTQVDTQNPALPDPDHEGHGGYRIDQIDSGVQGWLAAVADPDVILLIIGTNDFTQNYNPAGAPGRLGNLITQISTLRPDAKILLGNLPLRTDSASLETDQNAYNTAIPGIVSNQVSLGHHVYFVDMHSSFNASGLSSDGVHPNPAGYDAMADVWAQAIMQIIPPPSTPPSILTNGSFEFGALVSTSPYTQYQLDNWSATGTVTGFPGNSNCPATNGTRMALFNGASNTFTGTISQTFATTPGTIYRLDFNLGIIAAAGQAPRQQLLGMAVTDGGGGSLVSQDVPLTASEGPAQWTPRSCLFTATTATTTLAFTDKSGTLGSGVADFSDMLLDHVRVIVAPPNSAPVADDDSYSTTAGATLVVAAPGVLDGDTDVDPQPLTTVLVTSPSHGSLTLNPNGSFSYTLDSGSGFTGTDSFTYKASDGSLDSNVATVSIVITPAQPLTNGSFESGALVSSSPYPQYQMDAWTVTGSPSGFPGNSSAPPTDGSRVALFNGGGNNFTGTVSQTFATTPGESYRLQFDLGIIAAAGQAPRQQLLGVALTGEGGGSLFLQDMPLTAIEGPAQWTARSFSFTAISPTTTLAFTDKSGSLGSGVADFSDLLLDHVQVNVAPPNTPPVADNDSYSTDFGTTLVVAAPGVLDGDTDGDSQSLTAMLVAGPSHGSLILNPDGNFSYTPNSGFAGTDSFTYKANDGSVGSNTATVTIVVNPPDVLANGSFEFGALISATPFPRYQLDNWTTTGAPFGFPGNSVANATDGSRMALLNGGSNTFTDTLSQTFATTPGVTYRLQFDLGIVVAAGQAPRHQLLGVALTGDGGGSLISQDMSLTGNEGPAQWTARSLTFTASTATTTLVFTDKSGTLAPGVADYSDMLLDHVRVNEAPPNSAPVADNDSYTTDFGTLLVVAAPGVLDGDTDVDSQTLTAVPVAGPSNGSLTLNPDGSFNYTPNSGFAGTDSFTYKATDGFLNSNTATVTVVVNPAGPLANGSFELGALISATPFPRYQLNSWTATGAPFGFPGNSVASATDGSRMALFNGGSDTFTDMLSQTFATTPGVTYQLNFDYGIVVAAGQAPRQQLLGVAVTGEGGGSLVSQDVPLTGNEGTAQWTARSYSFTATTATTTLVFTDKSGTLAPGVANFSDLLLDHVRVNAVNNNPPLALAQSVNLNEDVPTPVTLAGSDVDGDSLTFTVTTGPSHGALSGTAPNLTYIPVANYNGPDSFSFKVNDGTVDSAPATVTLTVTPLNDAPLALAQSLNLNEDAPTPVTLAGSDVDGDALTFTVTAGPSHGALSGTAPNLTYIPVANYNGPDSFAFTANDGTVDSAPATVTLTVAPLNDAPLALVQSPNLNEDVPTPVTLTGSDVDGDSLTFTVTTGPSHGTLSGTAPDLTYTPATNYNGPDSFAFTANDGTVDSAPATVTVAVAPLNDAPLALAQSLNLNEDAPTPVTLTGSDVDGDTLTFTVTTGPSHGALSGTAPNLTYTPATNYNGPDSFAFTVNDGTVDSAPAMVTLAVAPLNDAPLALAQSLNLNEDVPTPVTLAGSDVDGDVLTFTVTTSPSHGALSGTAPDLTYTPVANYNGPDSFAFTANDGTVDSAPATVTLTIAPLNDAPLALAQSLNLNEDVPTPVTLTGSDVDGDTLTFTVTTGPSHGALSGTAPNLTYTPATNYNGPDSFAFTVNDGTVDSAPAMVTLAVAPLNDAPLALAQSLNLNEDVPTPVTLAGSDVDGDVLTFTVTTSPSHGALSGTAPDLTYTPVANYNGPDSFALTVNDGTVDSAPATVTLTIAPLNDAPLALAQALNLNEDVPTPVTLTGSDVDGDTLTFTVTTGPSHGALSGTAPNLTYTPATNYNGPDSFAFTVNDGTVDSAPAMVTLTVAPLNDAPLALAQSPNLNEDVPTPVTLAGSDVDGDVLTFTVTTSPSHGALSGTAPDLTYTPVANYNGPDSFAFTANDGTVDSAPATVTLTIAPLNDAPLALAQALNLNEDVPTPVTLTGSDVDGDTLTFTVTASPSHGTLSGTAPDLTYTPAANYNGPDSFAFTVNDGTVDSAPAMVTLAVAPLNDAPLALAQSLNLNEDVPTPVTLAGSDVDGDPLTFTVTTGPSQGTLSGTAPNLTYTPAANYHGPDSFAFTANDGTIDSAPATITLTVAPLNDAPLALAQSVNLNEDVPTPVTLAGSDVDGDSLTFTVTTGPSHGILSGTAPNLTYTPVANYNGPDSFAFAANDGTVDSAPATVTITVAAVVDSFPEWLAGFGTTGNPGDDPDHDSITNAVEYAIGGNPANHSDVDLLPSISLVSSIPNQNLTTGNYPPGNYVLFCYRRTQLAKDDPSTTIRAEWSEDLVGPWTTADGTHGEVIVEVDNGAGNGIDNVNVYIPCPPSGRLFGRLGVAINTP